MSFYYELQLELDGAVVASKVFTSLLEGLSWTGRTSWDIEVPQGSELKEYAVRHDHEPTDEPCDCPRFPPAGENLYEIRERRKDWYIEAQLVADGELVARNTFSLRRNTSGEMAQWFGEQHPSVRQGYKELKEYAIVHRHPHSDQPCDCPRLEPRWNSSIAVDQSPVTMKKVGMVRSLMKCPECGDEQHVTSILRHINEEHPGQAWELLGSVSQALRLYEAGLAKEAQARTLQQKEETQRPPFEGPGTVILESKRGSRVGAGTCSECGKEKSSLTRYSKSNLGPVLICDSCKPTVFERIGRKGADAIHSAYRGGRFSPK